MINFNPSNVLIIACQKLYGTCHCALLFKNISTVVLLELLVTMLYDPVNIIFCQLSEHVPVKFHILNLPAPSHKTHVLKAPKGIGKYFHRHAQT